jgi:hypothetical protein
VFVYHPSVLSSWILLSHSLLLDKELHHPHSPPARVHIIHEQQRYYLLHVLLVNLLLCPHPLLPLDLPLVLPFKT